MLRGSYATAVDEDDKVQWQGTELSSLVGSLPETIHRQYTYEEPLVRSCKHLSHSPFFKVPCLLHIHALYIYVFVCFFIPFYFYLFYAYLQILVLNLSFGEHYWHYITWHYIWLATKVAFSHTYPHISYRQMYRMAWVGGGMIAVPVRGYTLEVTWAFIQYLVLIGTVSNVGYLSASWD